MQERSVQDNYFGKEKVLIWDNYLEDFQLNFDQGGGGNFKIFNWKVDLVANYWKGLFKIMILIKIVLT